VVVNGLVVTVTIDGKNAFSYQFSPRILNGESVALNRGMVGFGSNQAQGLFDNIDVTVISPAITVDRTEQFDSASAAFTPAAGSWSTGGGRYTGTPGSTGAAIALVGYAADGTGSATGVRLQPSSYLEVEAVVAARAFSGIVFDYYDATDFKFVALDVAGNLPTATTPALTASPRPHVGWCPDAPVQAHELSARHAARVVAEDFKPRNYDGEVLKSQSSNVPLPIPHVNSRASQDSNNAALRSYFMTPYAVDGSNQLTIVRSRTTSNAADARLWDTGTIDTIDWTRHDYQVSMSSTFRGKNLKTVGTPKTPNTITPSAIRDFVIGRMFMQDDADFLDGADALKSAVLANINVLSPTRADVYIPVRPPAALHIVAPVLGLV